MEYSFIYVLIIVFGIWLGIISYLVARKLSGTPRGFQGGRADIKEMLNSIEDAVKLNQKEIKKIKEELADSVEREQRYLQKIGFLRFNPFGDTGGEQSFTLAILDARDSGVIVTALHGRNGTRWYTKKIERGKALDFELSKEEIQAIRQARTTMSIERKESTV